MTLITRRSLLRTAAAAAALPLARAAAPSPQDPLKVAFVYVGPVGDFG